MCRHSSKCKQWTCTKRTNGVLNGGVTQRAIIHRWTPDDLARELGLTPQALRAKALFWVNNGVLVEARGRRGEMFYQRAEALDDRAGKARRDDTCSHAGLWAGSSWGHELGARLSP